MSTTSEIHDRFMADNNAPYLDAYCAMHENAKKLETERDDLLAEVKRLKADKARIVEVAHEVIDYVGKSNYTGRVESAHDQLAAAMKGDK